MRKTTRIGKAMGGDIGNPFDERYRLSSSMHPASNRGPGWRGLKKGGGVSAKQIACGKPAGVRKGTSADRNLDKGHAEGKKSGNLAKNIGMGKPTGQRLGVSAKRVRFAEGGYARNPDYNPAIGISNGIYQRKQYMPYLDSNNQRAAMGFSKGGHASDESQERFQKARRRNDILGSPHYAEGGKVHQGMKALYHALHSHFENEPHMKKLGATKSNVYDGEPHRYAKGGHLVDRRLMQPSKTTYTKTFKKYRPQ